MDLPAEPQDQPFLCVTTSLADRSLLLLSSPTFSHAHGHGVIRDYGAQRAGSPVWLPSLHSGPQPTQWRACALSARACLRVRAPCFRCARARQEEEGENRSQLKITMITFIISKRPLRGHRFDAHCYIFFNRPAITRKLLRAFVHNKAPATFARVTPGGCSSTFPLFYFFRFGHKQTFYHLHAQMSPSLVL